MKWSCDVSSRECIGEAGEGGEGDECGECGEGGDGGDDGAERHERGDRDSSASDTTQLSPSLSLTCMWELLLLVSTNEESEMILIDICGLLMKSIICHL